MTSGNDWNSQIIDEFRANEGRVSGPFKGTPLLLLPHRREVGQGPRQPAGLPGRRRPPAHLRLQGRRTNTPRLGL